MRSPGRRTLGTLVTLMAVCGSPALTQEVAPGSGSGPLTSQVPPPDARTGQALPAGGGEPGKAYLAYVQAVLKKDLGAIRRMTPPDAPDVPEDMLEVMVEMAAAVMPADVRIVAGWIKGDVATLHLTGTLNGKKHYGTVVMRKAKGVWRHGDQNWSDAPPAK